LWMCACGTCERVGWVLALLHAGWTLNGKISAPPSIFLWLWAVWCESVVDDHENGKPQKTHAWCSSGLYLYRPTTATTTTTLHPCTRYNSPNITAAGSELHPSWLIEVLYHLLTPIVLFVLCCIFTNRTCTLVRFSPLWSWHDRHK
jgi:hypothetical protein